MKEKLKTALWFAQRGRLLGACDGLGCAQASRRPGRSRAWTRRDRLGSGARVPFAEALAALGFDATAGVPALSPDLFDEGKERARRSAVAMGGPGDSPSSTCSGDAFGRAPRRRDRRRLWVVELQAAFDSREDARIVSVDMPYPKMDNGAFVGVVVPERFRDKWEIVREPDRHGLGKATARLGGRIDLCHYDSLLGSPIWLRPSVEGAGPERRFHLRRHLQDNMAFAEFVAEHGAPFAVTAFEAKFVGIIRK